jgi:altronate hydrolase
MKIHPKDNVAVAVRDVQPGHSVDGVVARIRIAAGHKIALRDIVRSEDVIKYGYPIGRASRDIAAGEHVHVHNVGSSMPQRISAEMSSRSERSAVAGSPSASNVTGDQRFLQGGNPCTPLRYGRDNNAGGTFDGYRRSDGSVGIRNEIWIVNTVGCVNRASERIAREVMQTLKPDSGVDGVYAFTHPYGCSQLGDDLRYTQKALAGLVRHPNAAAVLVLGLGCENNQLPSQLEEVRRACSPGKQLRFFNAQEVEDEIERGVRMVRELIEHAKQVRREPIPTAELILGMKCGGSDGFSGITANPLVGRISNRLCGWGGTALLTEVPEMFGAEDVLLARSRDASVAAAVTRLVNDFREYFRRHNQPIDENPSPGNKDGGITTNAEKSLGCVQKGGDAPIVDVLAYGESAKPGRGGVALINAPGNDAVSSTALTCAGAHMILFTTGRGTPMGFPVPTIKIATNTPLAQRKPNWIDFDAGPLLEPGASIDAMADALMQLVLDVASGVTRTRNELNDCREIAIWKDGVTL